MVDNRYVTIGEMSQIAGITIKTLKYYQKIGLFDPEYIDEDNNYRYYNINQIYNLLIIQGLKNLEFSLDEIKLFINYKDLNSLEKIYKEKIKNIHNEIQKLLQIKKNHEIRLSQIQNYKCEINTNSQFGIQIKNFSDRHVVFIREKAPFNFTTVGLHWNFIIKLIIKHKLIINTKYYDIFHDDYLNFDKEFLDFEHCCGLKDISQKNYKFVSTIPAGNYATIKYKGSYYDSIEYYQKLILWIKENNYLIDGPLIREFLTISIFEEQLECLIVELQIKIKSA